MNSVSGLNLYRICQEVINNTFKHSQADELVIDISANEEIKILIRDNGIGFNKDTVSTSGFGLSNIESRAAEAGIKLELKTNLNEGVRYLMVV